jgi:hypothetical protein
LHLTLLSASSGSPLSALFLAARSAFIDLKIPRTKQIGWEGAQNDLEMGDGDLSGIKAALKVKGKGKVSRRPRGGDDWDLDREGDGEDVLDGREDLPVLVTLNLVRTHLSESIPISPTLCVIDSRPRCPEAMPCSSMRRQRKRRRVLTVSICSSNLPARFVGSGRKVPRVWNRAG